MCEFFKAGTAPDFNALARFKKVRKQVCKRIQRRIYELHLYDTAAYLGYLQTHPDEWLSLSRCCQITISRFNRDKHVYRTLQQTVIPELASAALHREQDNLACWSLGCASGEEPYTLTLLWHFKLQQCFPALQFHVLATDIHQQALQRAQHACYPASSLKELPADIKSAAFHFDGMQYCLHPHFRHQVTFHNQDIRDALPEVSFSLILCRNLVFTYFDATLQKKTLNSLWHKLDDAGILVVGAHETLPGDQDDFIPVAPCIYRKQIK